MITRKVGPALAAGLHRRRQTGLRRRRSPRWRWPCSAERAGVPKGVFNVVTGSAADIGGELTSNPTVRKISFTGSTAVGKVLMAQCAADGQEGLARAGRQRPLHRVRRCRSGRRGGGRDRLEVPKHGTDVRVRQPLARAGDRVRRVRGSVWAVRSTLEGRCGPRRGRHAGPAHRHGRGRKGREPRARRRSARAPRSRGADTAPPPVAGSSCRRC